MEMHELLLWAHEGISYARIRYKEVAAQHPEEISVQKAIADHLAGLELKDRELRLLDSIFSRKGAKK